MVYSLTWLPDILARANIKYAEQPEWRTRGRAEMGIVRGVMIHHTAGSPVGNMPSLDLLTRGRSDLAGPLAQLGLGRDGTFYIIAAGRANHAGIGVWRGITSGNSSFIGIEVENTGKEGDTYPEAQLDALRRGVAAILKQIGADATMVCGHKEYAPQRKIDPLWNMAEFREKVSALLRADVPPAPGIPTGDGQGRPTLRRGARGQTVTVLQSLLGIDPTTGNFGPVTEARLRVWQRDHQLVPDGIAGPKTWASFDGGTSPGSVATTPGMPATAAVPNDPLPPADTTDHPVTTDDRHALTPDGKPFAACFASGFGTFGQLGVDSYLKNQPNAGTWVSPSTARALVAVMGNEGKLEAVNSHDDAFMSFGIMQWTAGTVDGAGELAALLARLQAMDAAAFEDCFGRYGLSTDTANGATTGRLVLDGHALMKAQDKEQLRSAAWAYRFWRAGHHPAVAHCQIVHAGSRLALFADKVIHGHAVREWTSSELGMALLLDEHVNRPAHVPGTLDDALGALLAAGTVGATPSAWSQSDEDGLINRYIAQRNTTSMTNAANRAASLLALAQHGALATAQGSFS